ncbi:hypothetical protein SteCoe_4846 [Stentor coeruleus]|uniref:RanBP-type and C3HC4-type zinc finger-containing protein 1 n=1 Tax=Stentor coeruleus TaxID=5963 RepID=A0A1R2CTP8_9CILI|nr:hypothetical protein SteCoe_4846 [Stentor coeruleus]
MSIKDDFSSGSEFSDCEDYSHEIIEDDYNHEIIEDDYPSISLTGIVKHNRKDSYEIIDSNDIYLKEEDAISNIIEDLGLNRADAVMLLVENSWDPKIVIEKINSGRIEIPWHMKKMLDPTNNFTCLLCFEVLTFSGMTFLDCAHEICTKCYKTYLEESINAGRECLKRKCPAKDCPIVIPKELFQQLLSSELYEKYQILMINSFVDLNPYAKWCPEPGCNLAAVYKKNYCRDIKCICGHVWCFNCQNDAHKPLTCELLKMWNEKIALEDKTSFIDIDAKACPKCGTPIQKSLGCLHMTCICQYEFCWMCLGAWSYHVSITPVNYKCNKFSLANSPITYNPARYIMSVESEKKRFEHYFTRYMNHKASIEIAKTKHALALSQIAEVYDVTNETNILEFFSNATYLLFKAKQSLAYSYAIGYFLASKRKLDFFEFIQGELEQAALKLDDFTNIDVRKFIIKDQVFPFHQKDFQEYRNSVVKLTEVIKNFFEKSYIELESGLPEIADEEYKDDIQEAQMLIEEVNSGKWICQNCTFANLSNIFLCEMCNNPKDSYNSS